MLILYGLSFGGYFAPRGASGEDRIKILIANGGFYDLVGALAAINGDTKEGLLKEVKKDEAAYDRGVREVMKARTAVRFFIEHGMYSFGAKTPSELMLKGAEYTLKDRAELIKSTTVIVDSDEEMDIFEG